MRNIFGRIFLFINSIIYFFYSNLKAKINILLRSFKEYKVDLHKINKTNISPKKKVKILMMDTIHHRLNIYSDCLFVEYLQNIFDCEVTGLANSNDNQSKNFFKFIKTKKNIEINESSLLKKIFLFFEAYKIVNTFKTNDIENFIKLEIDGINLGRSVYDHLIRLTGYGSHPNLNAKFVNFLTDALYYKDKLNEIFKKDNYDYLLLAELQFLPSNILIQIALKNNVKVLSRIFGPKKTGVRLYKNFDERFQSNHSISNKIFSSFIKNDVKRYSLLGFDQLSNVFLRKTNNPDFFSKDVITSQNEFENKNELLRHFKWDKETKICTIFSHNMIDGNFYEEWKMFPDIETWLSKTLTIIKNSNQNLNWIIRAHPSEAYFKRLNTTTMKIFHKIIGNQKNIKLCPQFCSPNTIKNLTNFAITSHGSIGVEYPCFGIPSVICGTSYYSGNGFAYEPKNTEEYFKILNNVEDYIVSGLTENQVDLARAFYYMHENIITSNCPLLDDSFDISDKENFKEFIKDINALRLKYDINKDNFFKKFNKQILNNKTFAINE